MVMSDLLNEQLSALIDGELPPEETDLLLKRIAREPELARRYARYQAIGDSLRGERARPSAGLAQRICAAVAVEPSPAVVDPPAAAARRPSGRGERRSRRLAALRPVAGLGLAAAVGALAVMLVARDPRGGGTPVASVSAPVTTAIGVPAVLPQRPDDVPPVLPATAEPASYVTPAPGPTQLRPIGGATLANYVAAHARMSGALGGRDALIHLVSDPSLEETSQP
jgi:negative regulator of sigma E activity